MNIGMNLLLWTDDPTQDASIPLIEQLAAMGFDGIEVPVFNLDPQRYSALGRRLDALGLKRTASTARSDADDPISDDPAIRGKGIERNRMAVECAAAAGATALIGPIYASLGHFSGSGPTAGEWSRAIDGLRPVAEHARRMGLTLGLEPVNRFEAYLLNDAATTARFCREVDHPACRMMYDTFHAHIEEKHIGTALRACADMLTHVHISENDRSTPGAGQVDWDATFTGLRGIGYDGWLTIEAFGQTLPALAAATRIWRRMYNDEMQLARDGLAFIRRRWAEADATQA